MSRKVLCRVAACCAFNLVPQLLLPVSVALVTLPALAEGQLNSEVRRISPKRTVVLLDMLDGGGLRQGAKVQIWFEGDKMIDGVVRKLSRKGRVIVRLASAAPDSVVESGPALVTIVENGTEGEGLTMSRGQRKLWRESNLGGLHAKDGLAAIAGVSAETMRGALKVTGGPANEDVDFGYGANRFDFDGQAGYRAGAFGGGAALNFNSGSSSAEADIKTAATDTTDKDKINVSTIGFAATPYALYQAGSLSMSLGFQVGSSSTDRTVEIASVEGPGEPVTTTESGARVELGYNGSGFGAGLSVAPALSGKVKEDNQEDVDHEARQFAGFYAASWGDSPYRLDVSWASLKDGYLAGDLTGSTMGVTLQGLMSWGGYQMAPIAGYSMTSRELGELKGSAWDFRLGSRVGFGGSYAPYAGLELKYRSELEEASGTRPKYDTTAFGVTISGGTSI